MKKTKMEQEQINKIIESKEFKLQNFEKTSEKWGNYKKEKVDEFFSDNEEDIQGYLETTLHLYVSNRLHNHVNNFNWLNLFKEKMSKYKINRLMTFINNFTYAENEKFINGLSSYNLNKNELKGFTIIFYLRNYETINKIMKSVLRDYLKDYNKKTIIEVLD